LIYSENRGERIVIESPLACYVDPCEFVELVIDFLLTTAEHDHESQWTIKQGLFLLKACVGSKKDLQLTAFKSLDDDSEGTAVWVDGFQSAMQSVGRINMQSVVDSASVAIGIRPNRKRLISEIVSKVVAGVEV